MYYKTNETVQKKKPDCLKSMSVEVGHLYLAIIASAS